MSGWVFVSAGCGGSGSGAGDGGRSDAPVDAGEPDAGRFEPGDAAWPASPCGQPVRRYTVDTVPEEALASVDSVLGAELDGHGERLAVAHYNELSRTLWMQSFDLTDGSASEARADLPETGDGGWHVWAVASWAEPVALIAVRDPVRRLLWAEVADGGLEVTELAVPAELPWQDVVSFVPTEDGFVGLDDSGEDQDHLVRVTRGGLDASPIELPAGSRVELAGHAGSPYAVLAASRFEDAPRVELARVGPSTRPSSEDWRELLEGDRPFELDVTPRRVAVTALRDREVEIVWLDPSLDETGRDRLTLPYPAEAIAVGEERRALVAWGDSSGLTHGLLGEADAPSWRTLLDEPVSWVRAWRVTSGRHAVVARSGIVTADAFLVCGGEP